MRPVAIARTAAIAVDDLRVEVPLANPRARKMMSRAAYLGARCLADLLVGVEWTDAREQIGYFLGVGASGGTLEDMMAVIDASLEQGEFSLRRFGDRGLAACNPLLAFQLMNNFTLCHGAVLEGLGGPNSAFFSRGSGTVAAIAEAMYAIRTGECDRAVCGGADTPTHPVTLAELRREGFVDRGMLLADGVGLLALTTVDAVPTRHDADGEEQPFAVIEGCAHASERGSLVETMGAAIAATGLQLPLAGIDWVVTSAWNPPLDMQMSNWIARTVECETWSMSGETLAAGPALAVIEAEELVTRGAERVLVLTAGIDGDVGAIVVARGAR